MLKKNWATKPGWSKNGWKGGTGRGGSWLKQSHQTSLSELKQELENIMYYHRDCWWDEANQFVDPSCFMATEMITSEMIATEMIAEWQMMIASSAKLKWGLEELQSAVGTLMIQRLTAAFSSWALFRVTSRFVKDFEFFKMFWLLNKNNCAKWSFYSQIRSQANTVI